MISQEGRRALEAAIAQRDTFKREQSTQAAIQRAINVLIAHAVPLAGAGLMVVLGCEQDMTVALFTAAGQVGTEIPGRGSPFNVITPDPDTAAPVFVDRGTCDSNENTKLRGVSASRDRPCGGLAPGALRRVQTHVEQRLAEKIELAELAAIAKLSECHFSRAFKQSMGMPPHRYLMARRVNAAAALICQTDRSLTEISLEVGFSDQSHFTRTFTRATGETPSAFRHRHR